MLWITALFFLLQTSYKILAKILATRLQLFLVTFIGGIQSFFLGRRMDKAVTIMMATLKNKIKNRTRYIEEGAGILFLDFATAYDALDRDYLYATLRLFGFSLRFIQLMINLHCGTTAEFLVNNERSSPENVISGIRQGCPLAPLLFIIVAEPLAPAILRPSEIQGINPTTQEDGEQYKLSVVDDSTIVMNQAKQILPALNLVRHFGRLSGLKIEPSKVNFCSPTQESLYLNVMEYQL